MASQVARVGNNLPNGNFIPEVWSTHLNYKFYKQTYWHLICNTDWEGEISGKGSKVIIRTRPTVAVNKNYKENQKISYQDLTDESIELLIDHAHSFAFKVGDIDKMQQDIKAQKEATIDADFQMKIAVEETIFSTVYLDAGNALAQAALDKTNVIDWIIDAKTKLGKNNIPISGRWMIMPPEITGLLDKSDLKNAAIMGDGPSILRKQPDYLGRIAGFDIFESNNLTTTSGGVMHCIAGQRNGLTYAGQMNKVTTVTLQDYYAEAVRGLMVFGYKVNVPSALVHMPATVA